MKVTKQEQAKKHNIEVWINILEITNKKYVFKIVNMIKRRSNDSTFSIKEEHR